MHQGNSDEDYDLAYAISLQEEYDKSKNQNEFRLGLKKGESCDFALAVALQENFDNEVNLSKHSEPGIKAEEIVDEHWELTDPNPNIHQLFVKYDGLFFGGKLVASGVAVDWSTRMTL